MALVTRQVNNTGTPLYAPNGTLLVNKTITFVLVDEYGRPTSAFDGSGEHVATTVRVKTDANGEFTINLWPNSRQADKFTAYLCTIDAPDTERFTSQVPAGATPLTWLEFKLNGTPLTPLFKPRRCSYRRSGNTFS